MPGGLVNDYVRATGKPQTVCCSARRRLGQFMADRQVAAEEVVAQYPAMNIQAELPAALSITHLHLLAAINTELQKKDFGETIRVCDIGCGDGQFLSYMAECLPRLNPGQRFEFFGMDVADSGVQAEGFFASTVARLRTAHPSVDWTDRLRLMSASDPWPYPDGYFQIVTSNQVLEHVADHDAFMGQLYRTLSPGGLSMNLFPLKHYIWEGHIFMPLVHRIRQHDRIRAYIKWCSQVGLGSYKAHRDRYGMTLDHYSEEHADYQFFLTNYKSDVEMLSFCKANRLRADFSYTKNFYFEKLRMMRRKPARYLYGQPKPFRDGMMFPFFKRLSSVTLRIEKQNIYSR